MAVTKGEVGCALSHLKAYRKLIDSNNEVALVIEDDVIIPSNLKNIINEIVNRNDDEKKLVTLLSKVNKYINKPVYELSNGQGVFRTIDAAFAHGYIIKQICGKKTLRETFTSMVCCRSMDVILPNGLYKVTRYHPGSTQYSSRL
nr:hypothetical protein SYMBAF_200005 [Serratia symbiotica]